MIHTCIYLYTNINIVHRQLFFAIFISVLSKYYTAETSFNLLECIRYGMTAELHFPLLLIVIIAIMFYVCFPCTMNFIKMMINLYGKLLQKAFANQTKLAGTMLVESYRIHNFNMSDCTPRCVYRLVENFIEIIV